MGSTCSSLVGNCSTVREFALRFYSCYTIVSTMESRRPFNLFLCFSCAQMDVLNVLTSNTLYNIKTLPRDVSLARPKAVAWESLYDWVVFPPSSRSHTSIPMHKAITLAFDQHRRSGRQSRGSTPSFGTASKCANYSKTRRKRG